MQNATNPPPHRHPQELLTIEELSQLWRTPKGTLYNWVSQGRLPHVKLGRSLRFRWEDLENFTGSSTIEVAGQR